MTILGISAYFHDSAAAILIDGKLVAAAQEERFTRIKHDASFPSNSVNFCLEFCQLKIDDIDAVVFYEKPFQKFERILDSNIKNIPFSYVSFKKSMKSWFSDKLWIPKNIQKALNYKGKIYFAEHHESHAASAFFCSPFNESLIIVIDAVGEKSCTSICKGSNNKIEPLMHQIYPHSLGLFYSAFTYYCGFRVNSGEYKLMGLAPYGEPKYIELLKKCFINIGDDGTVQLNMTNFGFDSGLHMLSKNGVKALKKPVRKPESKLGQFYKDIAASVQKILEEAVLKIVEKGFSLYNSNHLTLAGGVALNCVANQKLIEAFPDKTIWIQPASGDAGAAIGAAFALHYEKLPREIIGDTTNNHIYLGPSYNDEKILETIQSFNAKYEEYPFFELTKVTANHLFEGKIVGWFQGRMEFGPRALGNRSILASPTPLNMKSRLNLAIKKREGFRPFAPSILEHCAKEWFEEIGVSKYMLQTFKSLRSNEIPSCIHEDQTSRVQTVSKEDNDHFYQLLESFHELSGVPILINTSFNLRGEPIVCSPEDAINCFIQTEMDILVLNNYMILKANNSSLKPSKNVIRILD